MKADVHIRALDLAAGLPNETTCGVLPQVGCGALGGTRTPNLLIRSQMLYPLSYERTFSSIPRPASWLRLVPVAWRLLTA